MGWGGRTTPMGTSTRASGARAQQKGQGSTAGPMGTLTLGTGRGGPCLERALSPGSLGMSTKVRGGSFKGFKGIQGV